MEIIPKHQWRNTKNESDLVRDHIQDNKSIKTSILHQYYTASSKSLAVALFRMICSVPWRDRLQYPLQGYWEECSVYLADNSTKIHSVLDSCWSGLAWVPVAWFCDMICGEFDSITLDEVDRIIWAVSLASCLLNPSPYCEGHWRNDLQLGPCCDVDLYKKGSGACNLEGGCGASLAQKVIPGSNNFGQLASSSPGPCEEDGWSGGSRLSVPVSVGVQVRRQRWLHVLITFGSNGMGAS